MYRILTVDVANYIYSPSLFKEPLVLCACHSMESACHVASTVKLLKIQHEINPPAAVSQ